MAFTLAFRQTDASTDAQPTLEDRVNAAAASAAWARNTFEAAAAELERASEEQAAIGIAVRAEVERLNDLALHADEQADRNAEAADKIRALIA
ncbi:hypothetical protein O7614_26570 [Micromonospora sp. WMMD961]|uniref:hypothetical protein n=1 Tax=Micromonospora sp. WMMD961 TaxID=3016100 RepID=UPI0024169A77|nr:hypothetical protein [Micromonospora sp. WMMD961]MDG4783229.1 hypothetical protein [Micromonospora sp. WMMD961]